MFEVLMFLFENFMDNNAVLKKDNDTIAGELLSIGFDSMEITRALDWLEGLNRFKKSKDLYPAERPQAIRHYLFWEVERLGQDGINFLAHLERLGVIDPLTREMTIDRVMALDPREVDMGRIKWVVLMALFNQPDKKSALSFLQDMILADVFKALH